MTYLAHDGKQVLSSLPFVRHISAEPFICDLQVDMTQGYNFPTGVTSDINGNRFVNVSSNSQGLPLCGVNTSGQGTTSTEVGKQNIIKAWDYFSSVLGQDISEEKYLGNISQSVNGDLTPRISAFINACASDGRNAPCPYGNAFWVPWSSNQCNSGACSGIFLGKDFDNSDDVIAHELAHSWSGNLVTNSTWNDFWLNEGFTTYFERRIVEDVYGKDEAGMQELLGYGGLQELIKEMGETNPDTKLKGNYEGRDPDEGVSEIAYEKGYSFLRTIEGAVGRKRFDIFLNEYFNYCEEY
jgi:hypothetical protein